MIGILDTAYTEKEENDPCAMSLLGIWHDRTGSPQVSADECMGRVVEFNPLVERVANTCSRFRADQLLIESKATGISVAQEPQRRYRDAGWGAVLVDPGRGDKVASSLCCHSRL